MLRVSGSNGQGQCSALIGAAAAAVLFGVIVPSAAAYKKYRINDLGGYCAQCHGHFFDHTSPSGTWFPHEGKHGMHRTAMGTACGLCHTVPGDLPLIGSSAGTATSPGVGCNGCHGRDYGGAVGVSGVGLRRHHVMNGIVICANDECHPGDPEPLPEYVMPIYFGTAGTLVTDPCNLPDAYGENFSADTDNHRGQDNDGDNQYDENDADCGGCPWDCTDIRDGQVGISDFLALLAQWGQVATSCDFGGGGIGVGITEFLELIANWGPCPRERSFGAF
jgi:hypothetical protein